MSEQPVSISILFDGKPAVITGFEEHFYERGYENFAVVEQGGQTYGVRYPNPRLQRLAMKMVPVTSSNIAEIGHDPDTNTLGVRFLARRGSAPGTQGPLYHYAAVPAEKHAALMAATDSHTRHLNANIENQHASTKMEG